MWGELAQSFQHANGYVIAIIAMGFLGTLVFFERLIMLQFVYNIDFVKFLGNLKKMVAAEDLDRAITLCKNVSRTSLPHISARALEAAETDPTTIRGTIEEETISFLPQIEKRLNVMPAFTILIMLVGVLGTIDALWLAFHSVDVLDTAKKQASLAQGIASSLNPTAMAMLFGMCLLAGHQLLKGVAINLIERVHHGVAVLSNLLVPPEVMAYAPAMAGDSGGGGGGGGSGASVSAPQATSSNDQFVTAEANKQGEAANDAFDDVSVEDIKDEEEII